ncbi:hypothetical protein GDO78_001949 [Eleutherodactylus coqui]|uniref:Uncharacterized protein n=1 Tax=Eleutherodactylus coqui TaxID=57060 RepID=A0A8J6FUW8_ELECQ|nr:hypothetical protein GDO78_001949 [Eleutherodactylus coqui]
MMFLDFIVNCYKPSISLVIFMHGCAGNSHKGLPLPKFKKTFRLDNCISNKSVVPPSLQSKDLSSFNLMMMIRKEECTNILRQSKDRSCINKPKKGSKVIYKCFPILMHFNDTFIKNSVL